MNMSKKNIIVGVIVVLVIAGVAFLINKQNQGSGAYSVVYMTTGEVYIGQLSTFPDFQLENGYILQVSKDVADVAKNTFKLQPLKDALWAPQSLHLIKDNIAFYGTLMSDSVIAKKLAEQAK